MNQSISSLFPSSSLFDFPSLMQEQTMHSSGGNSVWDTDAETKIRDGETDMLTTKQTSLQLWSGMPDTTLVKGSDQKKNFLSDDRRTKTFPQKLHDMLAQTDAEHAVAWTTKGHSFLIINPDAFVSDVLPKYFKQTKLASFVRKLNRWGFRRITRGPNAGAYCNSMFRRDNQNLCLNMFCRISGETSGKHKIDGRRSKYETLTGESVSIPFRSNGEAFSPLIWMDPVAPPVTIGHGGMMNFPQAQSEQSAALSSISSKELFTSKPDVASSFEQLIRKNQQLLASIQQQRSQLAAQTKLSCFEPSHSTPKATAV